jgi:hypothetical protein
VVERTIPTFAGLGAIATAASTRTIGYDFAHQIAGVIGMYLVFLALWSFFVEARAAQDPLKALEHDLAMVGDLLDKNERCQILAMHAVTGAKRYATLARWLPAAAYLTAAIAAGGVAFPDQARCILRQVGVPI